MWNWNSLALRMKCLMCVAGALLALAACRTMPPSNYASLSPAALERVRPFVGVVGADSLLQEVTAADLRAISQGHAFTWVVLWAPWCEPTPAYVRELEQYQQQLRARDVQLVLVDIQYSNTSALGKRLALRGGRPGYVLDWRRYGRLAPLRLRQELIGTKRLSKHGEHAIHFVLNNQQKLLAWSDSLTIPFAELEAATRSVGN